MTEHLPVPRPPDPAESAGLDVRLRPSSSGWTVLSVSGELDLATAARLRSVLGERLGAGEPVLLDAAGLSFLDASGLRVLVEAARLAAERHTAFAVWRPGSQPRRVMYLTHLDRTLRILDDVPDPRVSSRRAPVPDRSNVAGGPSLLAGRRRPPVIPGST